MSKKLVGAIAIIVALVIVLVATYMLTRPAVTPDANPETTAEREDNTNTGANNPTKTSPQIETDKAETTTITATNQGFMPAMLTVKKGTVLRIINNSDSPIEFSSDNHPSHRENPEMNMSPLEPGNEGTVTVTTVGEHGFHDHLNASHTGVLTVTE
jgi:plastocyanin